MWVRSQYAGELAVLATWLTALLPWSASFLNETLQGTDTEFTVVNIRFLFFQFHYLFGISFGDQSVDDMVQLVWEAPAFVPTNQEPEAWLWVAGAAVFALLLVLSFAYYARDEELEARLPVDPVRLFGGVFLILAIAFSVATALFFEHQRTVPVGALFMWVFAVMLLRVERT